MSLTTIYLPSIIKEGVDHLKLPSKQAGKVLFMLSCIIGKYRKDNTTFDDFIPIASSYKIEILNKRDYSKINKILEQHFLEGMLLKGFTTYSIKRNICKHYRLKEKYRSLELKRYEIEYKRTQEKRQAQRFVVSKTKEILNNNITLDLPTSLDEYLNGVFSTEEMKKDILSKISIQPILSDSKKVKYLHCTNTGSKPERQTYKEILRSQSNTETFVEYTHRKKSRYFLIDNFNLGGFVVQRLNELKASHRHTLLKIQDKDFYCDVSDTNNRLHTNLSELASIHLKYIKIDNEKIFSLDKKNSQLTLLACLLKRALDGYKEDNHVRFNRITSTPRNVFSFNKRNNNNKIKKVGKKGIKDSLTSLFPKHVLTVCKSSNCIAAKNVKIFIQKSQEGTVYEYIYFKLFGDPCSRLGTNKITKEQRGKIKIIVFEILFSIYTNDSKDVQKFKQAFPYIYEILRKFKIECKQVYDKELAIIKKNLSKQKKYSQKQIERFAMVEFKDKHNGATTAKLGSNQLAIMLQTFESSIFVDKILYKLLRKNIVCFSKHDSILFKESDLKKVQTLMTKELDQILGVDSYKLALEDTTKKDDTPPEILTIESEKDQGKPTTYKSKSKQPKNPEIIRPEAEPLPSRQSCIEPKKTAKTSVNRDEVEIKRLFNEYEDSKVKETGHGYNASETKQLKELIFNSLNNRV